MDAGIQGLPGSAPGKSPETQAKPDQVKQASESEACDEAIVFLYRFRGKSRPSPYGAFPDLPEFERGKVP